MFTYDITACYAAETLDKYNFDKDIEYCMDNARRDAWDLREYLMSSHGQEVEEALEDLSLDEFMEYMKVRYRVRWDEIITYRMF